MRKITNFYPRSPCGERLTYQRQIDQKSNFYPRSPCGERRWLRCWQLAARDISIHALLAESDAYWKLLAMSIPISIHALLAESDANSHAEQQEQHISIHALLAESDMIHLLLCNAKSNFYPRSPCGERPVSSSAGRESDTISIHALLAESDEEKSQADTTGAISIHALLAESDGKTHKLAKHN